jgi:hypothetical protein
MHDENYKVYSVVNQVSYFISFCDAGNSSDVQYQKQ